MTKVKLYTEDQVKKAIKLTQEYEHARGSVYVYYTETEVLEELAPIEIPSDQEIENWANTPSFVGRPSGAVVGSRIEGAEWVIDKIGGNKCH